MLTGVANLHQRVFTLGPAVQVSSAIWYWLTQCLSSQRRWIVKACLRDKSKRGGHASHYLSADSDHHGLVLNHEYSVLGMPVLI
jgi:hypothetical protein